ncbi:MAG: tetratricopeptide repeat protein [Acidobacteriota bacterium]
MRAAARAGTLLLAVWAAVLACATGLAGAEPSLAVMQTAEYYRIRAEGFDALYNMDYAAARLKFEELKSRWPEHPAGYFYLAANLWVSILNSSRRLQTNLYAGDSFFAETKEKVDPRTDREFRGLTAQAVSKAAAAVQQSARDVDGLYFQGAAHGLIATYEGTVARSFISALRNGLKAVNLHRKIIEIDPGFADAYLTIGSYDYVVGSLPWVVKVLVSFGGIRGSKERGLQELHIAAERARYNSDDARVVLITFYARERREAEMLELLDALSARYPRNYVFKLERAGALARLGRSAESFKIYDQMLGEAAMKNVADLVHFQYGDALAAGGDFARANGHFRAVIEIAGANQDLVTRAHLRSAQMLDQLHRRDEAVAEYKVVLARENVFDSHEQATKLLKNPYVRTNER